MYLVTESCRRKVRHSEVKGKGNADISLPGGDPHLRAMGHHLPCGITCHPTQVNAPHLTPAMQAGTRFTTPEGWKDELNQRPFDHESDAEPLHQQDNLHHQVCLE